MSAKGTESDTTKITVTPELEAGNKYKYKVGDEAEEVTFGQNVQNWSLWDGESDITAASDKVLTLVECSADYKAINMGSVTVVSND